MDRLNRSYCPDLGFNSAIIYTILKWIGLLVGCMAHLVAGSMIVFSVYQNDLKETFNYTQREVERQSSMLGGGFGMGVLAGFVFDRLGPMLTSLIGLLISASSYAVLCITSYHRFYFKSKSWFTAVFFFTSGLGSVFIYMVGLNTNILNFAPEQRCKVVGLLNAVYSGFPAISSVVYYRLIQNDNPSDSFGSCMLLLSVSFGVIGVLCMLCLRVYTPRSREILPGNDESTNIDEPDCHNDEQSETDLSEYDEMSNQHLSLGNLLQDVKYWLILGIFTFESTVVVAYMNNLTVISKSNGFSHKDQYLVLIIPINEAVFGLAVGCFSDMRKDIKSKLILLSIACLFASACISLTFIWGNNYLVLCFSTVLCGLAAGIIWTICPAAISEIFYVGDIGRNWGIALSVGSLLRWIVQEAFGILYDNTAHPGDTYCIIGLKCVRWGLLILVLTGVMSVVCSVILIYKIQRKKLI